MNYITLNDLREWIRVSDNVSASDARMESCIPAASRLVEKYCGKRIFAPDSVATARIFKTDLIDDFWTMDGLIVEVSEDRSNWHPKTIDVDFWVGPDNAPVHGEPYYQIRRLPRSFWCANYLRATAKWGWSATPDEVTLATKLTAHWLYMRPGSPFGITFLEAMPTRISRYGDVDVCRLLNDLRRGSTAVPVG